MTSKTPTIFINVETTGLLKYGKIVEISAVKYVDGVEVGTFNELINPLKNIPLSAIYYHGITNWMVKNKPPFCDVAPRLAKFLHGSQLAGHNIENFDYPMLLKEFNAARIPFAKSFALKDILKKAKKRLPNLESYTLEALREQLGIHDGQEHRALNSVRDAKLVYNILMSEGEIKLREKRALNTKSDFKKLKIPFEFYPAFEAMTKEQDIVIIDANNKEHKVRPLGIAHSVLKARDKTKYEQYFHFSRISLQREEKRGNG